MPVTLSQQVENVGRLEQELEEDVSFKLELDDRSLEVIRRPLVQLPYHMAALVIKKIRSQMIEQAADEGEKPTL